MHADLACGRHRQLVPELEALTADFPLVERIWEARILALVRSGRTADALRAYQTLRGFLREELGIDPSAPLQELEATILDPRNASAGERTPREMPGDRNASSSSSLISRTRPPAGRPRLRPCIRPWPGTR